MRNSNLLRWLTAALALALSHGLRADELTLAGEARLTGTVRSIDESGVVGLETALSPERLLLKPEAFTKVEFSVPATEPPRPGSLIELANGDLLPATIESLDDTNLTVTAAESGRLVIPRAALRSLQLGVRQLKVIYSGPRQLDEWTREADSAGSWTFSNKSLVVGGSGQASRDFKTPRQFILKFTLKWQSSPAFQIFFADPLKPRGEVSDRYYLQFNSAGMEIKRESTQGKRYHTIIPSSRTPDQFPNGQVEVEIRVDRDASKLQLFLNGEPEGTGIDPMAQSPVGGGLVLVSNGTAGSLEIRGIEITEFDNTRARHRAEDRGDPHTDSLISREDDRWGGRLTRIRRESSGAVFTFKSDFLEEPLELGEKDVSTLFFATPKTPPAADDAHTYILRLRGEGSLRVVSCVFSEDAVTARHPLLGEMRISRFGVASVERPRSKPSTTPEK
jgi:hypothetical protein